MKIFQSKLYFKNVMILETFFYFQMYKNVENNPNENFVWIMTGFQMSESLTVHTKPICGLFSIF